MGITDRWTNDKTTIHKFLCVSMIEPGESDCREEWADVRNENEESIKEVDKEL